MSKSLEIDNNLAELQSNLDPTFHSTKHWSVAVFALTTVHSTVWWWYRGGQNTISTHASRLKVSPSTSALPAV